MLVILLVLGGGFALSSSLHSFLILAFSGEQRVSQDVGLYYMSNALGRLLGTITSGAAFVFAGLPAALVCAAVYAALAALSMLLLPRQARSD